MSGNRNKSELWTLKSEKSLTDRITVIILTTYIFLIGMFFVMSFSSGNSLAQNFYDLTKTGFTTLGSALTLILGYYFGQRSEQKATEADAKEKIEDARKATSDVVQLLKSNPSESQPENLSELNNAQLPVGRPSGV